MPPHCETGAATPWPESTTDLCGIHLLVSNALTCARYNGSVRLVESHLIGERTSEAIPHGLRGAALATWRARRLRLVGRSHAREPFRFVRLRPHMAQILVCEDGVGEVLVDGAWHRLLPGEAYLTPPVSAHAYHAVPTSDWWLAWAQFDPDSDVARACPPRPTVLRVDQRHFTAVIDGLYREQIGADDAVTEVLWIELLHRHVLRAVAGGAGVDHRLDRLWETVAARFDAPWTLSGLARQAGVGPEQLRRLCLARCGTPPMARLARLRSERAAALLTTTDLAISAIAAAVGYSDPFAFSAAFRRLNGVAPRDYRRRRP